MSITTSARYHSSAKTLIACLIISLMILGPLAPLATASAPSKPTKTDAALPAPDPAAPLVPNITATKTDSFPDLDGDGKAAPGETITYDVNINNNGSDATGVNFTDIIDANTTLVGGSLKVSPLAFADIYNGAKDTPLSVGAPGVLTNDTGVPLPTAVAIAGGATSQGGTVTLNTNGSFLYNPPAGFTGVDTFNYTVTNGLTPNDTAQVSITVDAPPSVTSTTPTNGATNQAVNTNLTVTLSEPVNVTGNWFQIVCTSSGTRNVADTVVTGGPTTFTINPNVDFTQNETCTVTVFAAQVSDQDSNDPPDNMTSDFVFSFTTQDAAPSVSTTTPTNGAISQTTNTNIDVTFSEPVNVTGNWFQIVCTTSGTRNVADTVVTGGPSAFTINPNADFAAGETCTVTVFAAQVTDQDSDDPPDNMAANFVFSFSTEAAPTVNATTPTNGLTQVANNTNISLTFSEPVNVTGNWFQIVGSTSGTRNVADTVVTGGPTTFTINPNVDFADGESVTVTVFAAQVTDQDLVDPPDNMAANFAFSFTIDQPPSVTATTPTNGATNQSNSTNITITFSEPVNVTGNWFQIVCGSSGTRNVADTVVTGGPTTFTINPNTDFTAGESCTVTVFAAQVNDQDTGDPPDNMTANFVFSFQTTDAAPTVTATTPTNGAVNQTTNTNIDVTFSEPVNVTGNWFQIVCTTSGTRNVADTVVTGGPTSFTINPNTDFTQAESCTMTIFAAQVTDQDSNDPPDNMAANFVFSFSMDAAPSITATTPTNGATQQTNNTNLSITFSEPVNVTGNWFQIVGATSGTRNVADTVVTGGPTTFTINPNVDFANGELVTVTVFGAQVSDQDGNDPPDNMLANFVFSFTIDQAPSVTATTPTNGATNVATNSNLSITFSEPVNVTGNWFQIVCPNSGTRNVADTVVTGGPTTFTVNPNADFGSGETCTVTVFAAQVNDQDSADPPDNMTANFVFSFTTVDVAPSVTSTTPTNGATNQASNTDINVTFSEPVNVTGNWFQIVCGSSGTRNVADTLVTGGPTTFTINPNSDFTPGESCTVTIFAAQVTDQDSADPPDNMVANFVFSFTIDQAPSVTTTVPTNNATDVALNSTITINFSENVDVATSGVVINCGSTVPFTPALPVNNVNSLVLTPTGGLPAGSNCTVTVDKTKISDTDTADPPDNMINDFVFSFKVKPDAVNDAYPGTLIGNVSVNSANVTPTPYSITSNDVSANTFSITAVQAVTTVVAGTITAASANGGTVVMSVTGGTIGRFTYNPPAGFEGTDTFTYTISRDDGGGTDSATVSIPISGMIWFINNNAASCVVAGCGRLSNPFSSLAAFQALNNGTGNNPAANDNIFVYESATDYVGPVTLLNGQKFIGQDATAALATVTGLTPPLGSDPLPAMNSGNGTITNITSAGVGITLGQNNTLRGFTGGNATTDITGNNFGTLNVADVTLNGNGQALNLTTGTLAATFLSISSTNSATTGISLTSVGGSLVTGSTTITNSTGIGISVNTSSAALNFANTSIPGSGNTGVSLTTNTGTITFGDLDISPDANQRGLLATNNTNTITSTSGTISTSGAPAAVEITRTNPNTTPLAIVFDNVSANGGTKGITLDGTSGSFTINGTGTTDGTGGTIQTTTNRGAEFKRASNITLKNMTFTNAGNTDLDADNSGLSTGDNLATNAAIHLENVTTATLNNVDITGGAEQGINGNTVSNFNLINSTVTNVGNGADEDNIHFYNMSGTSAITNTTLTHTSGGGDDNLQLQMQSGTLTLTISGGSAVGTAGGVNQLGSGYLFGIRGTSNATINITNGSSTNNFSGGIVADAFDTATMNLNVTNSTSSGNNDDLSVSAGDSSNVNLNATGNTLSAVATGDFVPLGLLGSAFDTGYTFDAVISNNNISVANGLASDGMVVNNAGGGAINAAITNNTITYAGTQRAIVVQAGQDGNGANNITITGNNVDIQLDGAGNAVAGFLVQNAITGPGNTSSMCADIGGASTLKNTFTHSLGGTIAGGDIRVRQRNDGTVRLPGFAGPATNMPNVVSYLSGRNTVVSAPTATFDSTGFAGGAACTQPNLLNLPTTGSNRSVGSSSNFASNIRKSSHDEESPVSSKATTPFANASVRNNSDQGSSHHAQITKRNVITASSGQPQAKASGTLITSTVANKIATGKSINAMQDKKPRGGIHVKPTIAPLAGETVTQSVGTLLAGKTVHIQFKVTVNNPYFGGATVSNQGTVSGSNFADVLTDDPAVGGANDPTTTPILLTPNVSISDAQANEPSSGSTPMIFTVSLSAPAPAGGASIHYQTADQAPAAGHAVAGTDYTAVPDTVLNFAAGEQFKTISVNILADGPGPEPDETFLVNLSNSTNATIVDGQAVGTIKQGNAAGTFLISELRTSGPGGAGDDFVELYNNTDSPLVVSASDASGGYGLFKMGADCNATPVLIGTIPNGTTIPARGHYLFVGSAYSLADYGGTGAAAGNQTLTADIQSDGNVAIFNTASVANLSTVTRLDAVGFGTNTGGTCDLLREGTTLAPLSGSTLQYTYVRDECGKKGNPAIFGPCPTGGAVADTNVNGDDFIFVDTSAANTVAGQRLGAPGPQNLASPIVRNNTIIALLLDSNFGGPAIPNRVRNLTPVTNGANGTMSVRRRFVNNTGAPVTRLRIRVVDISTISVPGGIADIRALSSTNVVVSGITDNGTCTAAGLSTPCTVTVQGTTLETPPAQALGGGHNSSMTINLGTPLAPGASINLQFLLGVQQTGSFKFFFNIEALP